MEAPVQEKQESSAQKVETGTGDHKKKYLEKNADPNAEKQDKPEKNGKHQKRERNEKHQKRERPARPEREQAKREQYDYNADLITQDTLIPAIPKKNSEKVKPEMAAYKEREQKIRDKIYKLKDKKKQIRAEKFLANHKFAKGEDGSSGNFRVQVEEVQNLRDRANELLPSRKILRGKFKKLIDEAKDNNAVIKTLSGSMKGSRENIFDELKRLQHRFVTDDLSKQEEKMLNTEIMSKKRVISQAESSENLQIKLSHAEERRDELNEEIDSVKTEKDPIEKQIDQLFAQMDKKNEEIQKLKGVISTESSQKSKAKEQNEKEWEQWKTSKGKRQDVLQEKIQKHEAEIEKVWDQFYSDKDEYWKQKHYLDYLKWQTRIKQRKIDDHAREEKHQEYLKKQREREKEDHLQKHIGEIELCNFLINYCKGLYPEDNPEAAKEKAEEIDLDKRISEDSQWKKEKGLEVVHSKKSQQDDEPSKKKSKKSKKNKEEKKEHKFDVPFNVQVQFEKLKVLAPESVEDIERSVKELQDREKLYQRACQEEVTEEDQRLISEIKSRKSKGKAPKKSEEEDFPEL